MADDWDKLLAPISLEDLFKPEPNVSDVDFEDLTNKFPQIRYDLKCGDCGSDMHLVQSPKFKRPFYGCRRFPECRGTMGAHDNGSPLGTPIDTAGRVARKRAHAAFDRIWQEKSLSRSDAYKWMQQRMNLTSEEAHISRLSAEQCEHLIALAHRDFPGDAISQVLYDEWDDDPSDL